MKKIYYLLTIVFTFLLIYYPPLTSINMLHVIGVISWVYIFINFFKIIRHFNMEIIVIIYIVLFSFMIYLAIIAAANGTSIAIANKSFLFWTADVIPASIVIVDLLGRKLNRNNGKEISEQFLKLIMIVGFIQAGLSLIAFLNPNFQAWFISQMINYGYDETRYTALANFRWYGVASNLAMTTSVVQAFISVIMIYLAVNYKITYLFGAFAVFFSAFINSRNSFVVVTVGIALMLLLNLKNKKINVNKVIKVIFITLVSGIFISTMMYILSEVSPVTYEWLVDGISDFIKLIFGSYSSDGSNDYVDYVTDSSVYTLPPTLGSILFGTGEYTNSSNILGFATDVGYVNDIWLGGVVYALAMYSIFILAINKLIHYYNSKNNGKFVFISLFFLSQFIVQNVKGYVFSLNDLSTLFILFFIITFMRERRSNER